MRKKLVLAPIMMAAVLSFTACTSSGSTGGSGEGADREVLFQVSSELNLPWKFSYIITYRRMKFSKKLFFCQI